MKCTKDKLQIDHQTEIPHFLHVHPSPSASLDHSTFIPFLQQFQSIFAHFTKPMVLSERVP